MFYKVLYWDERIDDLGIEEDDLEKLEKAGYQGVIDFLSDTRSDNLLEDYVLSDPESREEVYIVIYETGSYLFAEGGDYRKYIDSELEEEADELPGLTSL